MTTKKRIAFFMRALRGGGAEKAVVNLLKGFAERNEFDLDLVLSELEGPYLDSVPKEVRIVNLNSGRVINAIFPLVKYLKKNRPWVMIGNMAHVNVIASIARELSGTKTPLVLVEQNTVSANKIDLKRAKFVPPLMKWLYPRANAVAGVSAGVARDLEDYLGLKKESVKVLNNPVVNKDLIAQSKETLEHDWLINESPPVFLAVGRLNQQKDFSNLLHAFAEVRKQRDARLIILGEGEERQKLETLADSLEIRKYISMPGFVGNPYAYMKKSSCFVLSSRQEGLPTVLIEAMACGCPVVATDCPSGPDEILDHGTYGLLVPVKNSEALSDAMLKTLENPPDKNLLVQRANEYSTEKVVDTYLSLLHAL